ncbi:hypothetical protein [Nocardioides yefusunii]|uniref:Uncharacterized protein n=1 Tax=Nocardioides yefusunii TaxID=2500546 RepID=A0ABW1QZ46_9ACTN|nr:hypothetical protein [Nocardioides yefusunii]
MTTATLSTTATPRSTAPVLIPLCACRGARLDDVATRTIRGVEHTEGACVRVQAAAVEYSYQCRSLPLWVRVCAYAEYNHGRALARRELRDAVAPDSSAAEVSNAIRKGVYSGLLRPGSSGMRLWSNVAREVTNRG